MAEKDEKEKIIIDESWKTEAQKEKEGLPAKKQDETPQPPKAEKAARPPLPEGDFAALISMLVTQALFALGIIQVEGQKKEPDFEFAKYNIDMLETLVEKTKGNLTEEEKEVLENMLGEVRMAYVKLAG